MSKLCSTLIVTVLLFQFSIQQMVPVKTSEGDEKVKATKTHKFGGSDVIEAGHPQEEDINGLGREMPINQNFFNDLKKKNLNIHFFSEEDLEKVIFELKHSVILFQNPDDKEESLRDLMVQVSLHFKKRNSSLIFGEFPSYKNSEVLKRGGLNTDKTSVVFFEKTKKNVYQGAMNSESIVEWLAEKLERKLHIIKTREDFFKFHNKTHLSRILAIYEPKMKKEKALLQNLIWKDIFADSGSFIVALTDDQSIIPIPADAESPSLVMYNRFQGDEHDTISKFELNKTSGQDIADWIQLESIPLVSEFNEENSFRIFGGPIPIQLGLILDPKVNNSKFIEEFKKAAKGNYEDDLKYERVMFYLLNNSTENDDLLDFFDMKHENTVFPKIFLTHIDNRVAKMEKYEYQKDEIEAEFIRDFLVDFRMKRLRPYFKSEPIPAEPTWPVKFVGKNFIEEVMKNRRNQIILFCSEFEKDQCVTASKLFYHLAQRVNPDNRTNVVFATFDVTKNEVEQLDVDRIPDLRIYLRGEKKKPKHFQREFELSALTTYIKTYFKDIGIESTPEFIEQISLEIMTPEDRELYLQAKKNAEEQRNKTAAESVIEIENDRNVKPDSNKEGNEIPKSANDSPMAGNPQEKIDDKKINTEQEKKIEL